MVAGGKYEEVQCFLGEFDWQDAMDKDVERLIQSQKSIKHRLLQIFTSEALRDTLQLRAAERKKRAESKRAACSGEALEKRQKARYEVNLKLTRQALETGLLFYINFCCYIYWWCCWWWLW